MKQKILSIFEAWANWKGVLLFAVLELAFPLFIFPAAAPKTGLAAQTPLFDATLGYTAADITRALALFTPAQRRTAAIGHLTLDVLYPLAYGTFLSLLLILVYRAFAAPERYRRLLALPWLAVLADYAENLALSALFLAYPARLPLLARLAPVFTGLKWALTGLSLLAVLWGLLRVLVTAGGGKRAKAAAGLGVLLILLPAAGWAGVSFGILHGGLPRTEGDLQVDGLHAAVTIRRDASGIPHITAADAHDLFFAQGFVHAQDRLWQMESYRRAASGTLSAVIGERGLDNDRFMRTLGMTQAAQADWERLDSESRAALEAYAEGVNAYLQTAGSALPPEFKILGIRPEPWKPLDSLVFGKLLAWGLSNNYQHELILADLSTRTSWEKLLELLPEYPGPNVIPDAQRTAAPAGPAAALLAQAAGVEAVNPLFHPDQGSNAWVVGGSRTASGMPMLANDPHQGISMPSLWYEVGLHSRDGAYNVAGASLPGIPGIEIGHNAHIAWGVTNARPDVQDIFVETLDESGERYLFRGEWRPLSVRQETIEVKKSAPVTLTVRQTHHGPLISDVVAEAQGDWALRWTGLDAHPLLQAILELDRAADWDSFRAAVADWEVPGMNFVYADTEGHIGYQMSGEVPIRADNEVQGLLPVDGADGAHEWVGFIPFEEMPHALDPAADFFASANNRPVGEDYPYFLSRYFQPPYRVARISDFLRRGKNLTPEDFERLQADWFSGINLGVARALVNGAHPQGPAAESALGLLRNWDGVMSPESGAAALSEAALRHIIREAVSPEIGSEGAEAYLHLAAYPYMFLQNILDDPESPWWHGEREAVLSRALQDAVAELQPALGADPAAWTWGGMHAMVFSHPLGKIGPLRPVFNRGPYPTGGNWNTIDSGAYYPDSAYVMGLGPAYRIINDLSDWDATRSIIPTGQSGHPYSPHYDDQIAPWLAVEYHPLPFSPEAVEAGTVEVLRIGE